MEYIGGRSSGNRTNHNTSVTDLHNTKPQQSVHKPTSFSFHVLNRNVVFTDIHVWKVP